MKTGPLFIGLLIAQAASGQAPPIEFKGVPMGATVADLRQALPSLSCEPTYCAQLRIRADDTVSYFGGIPPDSYWVTVTDGRVAAVSITFGEVAFQRIAAGLIEKYGQPTQDTTTTVTNRMGAPFANRIVRWDRPDGRIEARQRGGSVSKSVVEMMSQAEVAANRDKLQKQPSETAKLL